MMGLVDGIGAAGQAGGVPGGQDPRCALCAVPGDAAAAGRLGGVAYLDDEVVAVVGAGGAGVLLAPRSHVGSLGELPPGALLAALRRAATAVEVVAGAPGATVAEVEVSGADGHVCFSVAPPPPPAGGRPDGADATAGAAGAPGREAVAAAIARALPPDRSTA